jgi:hypothetical protein
MLKDDAKQVEGAPPGQDDDALMKALRESAGK